MGRYWVKYLRTVSGTSLRIRYYQRSLEGWCVSRRCDWPLPRSLPSRQASLLHIEQGHPLIDFFLCSSLDQSVPGQSLRSPARLEDLVHVLLTVLIRRLKVVELLVQIRDVRLQFRSLRIESLFHVRRWIENEPDHSISTCHTRQQIYTYIFPTPSYTFVSFSRPFSSLDVSSSMRMSRCLLETAVLTSVISRWAEMACASISWTSCEAVSKGRDSLGAEIVDLLQGFVRDRHLSGGVRLVGSGLDCKGSEAHDSCSIGAGVSYMAIVVVRLMRSRMMIAKYCSKGRARIYLA